MKAWECRSGAHVKRSPTRRRATPRCWCTSILGLAALLSTLLAAPGAQAVRSAPLKVRGSASIIASARASSSSLEVRGSVTDDAGRPLGRAHLRMKVLNEAGRGVTLPAPDKCPPTLAVELARGFSSIPDTYILQTDAAGGFCLRVPGTLTSGQVELSFEDDDGLFEPARQVLEIDATRRTLSLTFSPQPVSLNLGQAHHTLFVDTKLKQPPVERSAAERIRLELLLREGEGDGPSKRIANATVQAGSRSQFDVPSSALGAPGRATLTVSFAGSESIQPTERSIVVSRTAQVQLTLAETDAASSWSSGTVLPLAVGYVGGAVPSGSVEARVMGRTVGIAPVRDGAANVVVRVESSRRHEVPVTLHYLPDSPWWRPGPPLEARVTTVSPASWTRWTWIALAGLVAGWTVLAWRRPRSRAPSKADLRPSPPGRPKLELLQRVAPNSGWTGRVLDAHDGEPVAQAEVQILGPTFRGSGTQHSTTTAQDGSFVLPPIPAPWPEGTQLRVTGVFHATLEQPLPPEGEVLVHLTTRRRALLERLGRWVERRGAPYSRPLDPTPAEVAEAGERQGDHAVAEWARGIENAAYGPAPPSAHEEQSLIKREPGT